jgi:hypothetical protein
MADFVWDELPLPPTKINARPVRSATTEVSAAEWNRAMTDLADLRRAVLNGEARERATTAPGITAKRTRVLDGRVQVHEGRGARWRSVVDSDDVLDVRDFSDNDTGGVGTGDEDKDTIAFQNLLAATPGSTRKLVIPKASNSAGYLLADQLSVIGSPSYGLDVQGEVGATARGLTGTVIKYVGDLGDVMLHTRGLNGSRIHGLTFDLSERADCGLWISEFINADGSGLIGSANIMIEHCYFADARAVTTADLMRIGLDQAGQPNRQTSEVHWRNCYFFGNQVSPGRSCIHIQTGANCKNFSVCDSMFVCADYGWYQPGASGVMKFDNIQAIAIGYNVDGAGILVGPAGNSITINDFQMENTNTIGAVDCRAKAFDISSFGETTVIGGYLRGRTPADDYGMYFAGPTTLIGFDFEGNDRVGSNVLKVQAGGGCLTAVNCYWAHNTTALKNAPIYDSGNNHLIEGENARVERNDLFVTGSRTSLLGATKNGVLPSVTGKPIACLFGSVFTHGVTAAGVTWRHEEDKYIVTIPYTTFQTGALTNTLTNLGLFRQRHLIEDMEVIATNFTGVTGPVTCTIGHDGDPDGFFVSFTVSGGAVTRGHADADFGVELAKATSPTRAGYKVPLSTERFLQATLTSASGNLSGLSGGQLVITVKHKNMGA